MEIKFSKNDLIKEFAIVLILVALYTSLLYFADFGNVIVVAFSIIIVTLTLVAIMNMYFKLRLLKIISEIDEKQKTIFI